MNKPVTVTLNILVSALLLGWLAITAEPVAASGDEESFIEVIKNVNTPFDDRSVPQVRQVLAPTVLAKEKYQGGAFRVLARKQEIERYKCSSCHTGKEPLVNASGVLTHGNVTLDHGSSQGGLVCIDCHHPEDRDYLEDKKGRKIDFDHSYQLCGQCHFRQRLDWVGGAHGKRAQYWAGDRVVYNCASCHDPHAPRFEKRFPATYSVPSK